MCIDGTDEQDWFQPIEIYLIDLNENQFDLQYIRTSQNSRKPSKIYSELGTMIRAIIR